ncbi:MAG: hypothetical protein HZA53_00790 [Planctomycetes bacterium]|nr:hypothetical protein [Planctomycetota bacterium]
MSRPHRIATSLAALVACSVFARAGVLVVDASGGGAFIDLAPAVAAAQDGDVVLVRTGSYSGFTVTNKALDLVADSGASVLVNGTVRIQNLALTRAVTLTGREVHAPPAFAAVIVGGNAGSVRIQGCTLRGGDANACAALSNGGTALLVQLSSDVAVARSACVGGDGAEAEVASGTGGYGLFATQSRVAVHDSSVRGGRGGDFNYLCPPSFGYGYSGRGGEGADVASGLHFFASGCDFTGGDGGSNGAPSVIGGCGAAGLGSTQTASADLRALDSTFAGGLPGGGFNPCGSGAYAPLDLHGATLTVLPGSARHLNASRVTREHQTARLEIVGAPGDRVELRFADSARFAPAIAARGVDLLARRGPTPVLQAGTIGPNGTLTIAWPVAELGPGVAARHLFSQAACIDTSGVTTLTNASCLVLLDSAY